MTETTIRRFCSLAIAVGVALAPAMRCTAGRHGCPIKYVNASNATPVAPFSTWATAATNIQDAIDVAANGDTVLVTNGVYASGGRAMSGTMTNRVAVDKAVVLQSVNGPEVTVIEGYNVRGDWGLGDVAIRCVYLTNGAVLSGFTLTNGAARFPRNDLEGSGGGVWCESTDAVVTNCTLTGNSASILFGGGAYGGTLNNCTLTGNWGSSGGGAYGATLNNCALTGNWADHAGGGASHSTLHNCKLTGNSAYSRCGGAAYSMLNNCTLTDNDADHTGGGAGDSTLNNCTLTGNSARSSYDGYGGGAYRSTLTNCILYYNTASNAEPNYYGGTLEHCCTTPVPSGGTGNITNEPAFVDAAAGNYRLQRYSACVDAGTDLSALFTDDLDANPRPLDGNGDGVAAFDIGAYEFVLTPEDALERLIGVLNDSGLAHPRPLEATLQAALAAIQRGKSTAAINQLHAFQNKVQAQVARSDPALAASFIQAAQGVIDVLRGDALAAGKP